MCPLQKFLWNETGNVAILIFFVLICLLSKGIAFAIGIIYDIDRIYLEI